MLQTRYNKVSMNKKVLVKRLNQRGMVSFMVTLIMMMVISLIVIGFSQVTRRNAREALDRQLSSQAYYAAESGVNVAADNIATTVAAGTVLQTKTSCPNEYNGSNGGGIGIPITPLSPNVAYTCVLVDPTPASIQLDGVNQQSSVVTPLNVTGSIGLKTLSVSWALQKGGTNTSCGAGGDNTFKKPGSVSPDWSCDFGVVRIDLVKDPVANIGSLPANTITIYLTPLGTHNGLLTTRFNGGGALAYVGSAMGCTTGECKVDITLLPVSGTTNYSARLTSLYRDTPVTITGSLANGSPANFSGAQAKVDVTGKAEDVLRRVQVRLDLTGTSGNLPSNALSTSSSICKHFTIVPGAPVPTTVCQP